MMLTFHRYVESMGTNGTLCILSECKGIAKNEYRKLMHDKCNYLLEAL